MPLNSHRKAMLAAIAVLAVAVGSVRLYKSDGGQEAHALGALRAIHSAQETFAASCAAGGYAASLDGLATPPKGASAGFVSPGLDIPTGGYGGYTLALEPRPKALRLGTASCNGVEVVSSYFVHAEPQAGVRGASFAMKPDGRIFMRQDGAPISDGLDGAELVTRGQSLGGW